MSGRGGTILEEIIAARHRRLEEAETRVPLAALELAAESRIERRDFTQALSAGGSRSDRGRLHVIAELKRASPSRGLLREAYRRQDIARGYEAAGASALSVLTEEQFFMGSLEDLKAVRESVRVPILRKDFILGSYQVLESVAAGADALLLIVAVLSEKDLRDLIDLSNRLRIAALVEVHTAEELDRAVQAGARIIGVNNRDLKTMEVTTETSFRLRSKVPSGCLAVSESGIKTAADLERLAEAGFNAALVGERLMLAENPGEELSELLGKTVPSRR
jgi:indole-3-glycerol phosphate synthase